MYNEDQYLLLSGLQHFRFCRRQWALIHVEDQWAENERTVDGNIVHERAHDSGLSESRGDVLTVRGVSIFSSALGVSGQCDVLEYRRCDGGITLAGKEGRWQPFPVEYKRGAPRGDTCDALQLCGQAMCLEDMLCCDVPRGAIWYNEIRRRVPVEFTVDLRGEVRRLLAEMHDLYDRRHTPRATPSKACNACSLKELCLPRLTRVGSVAEYIRRAEEGEE